MLTILPGRHQPPHRDHLRILRAALRRVEGPLLVGLIVDVPPNGPATCALEAEGREHNAPERCPFSFSERADMLESALSPRERRRVRVFPLPRPEVWWDWVLAMLPGERRWIVPDVGESFDDAKAEFFREKGDRVMRVRIKATVSGREVRDALAKGDRARIARMVPAEVARRLSLHHGDTENTEPHGAINGG